MTSLRCVTSKVSNSLTREGAVNKEVEVTHHLRHLRTNCTSAACIVHFSHCHLMIIILINLFIVTTLDLIIIITSIIIITIIIIIILMTKCRCEELSKRQTSDQSPHQRSLSEPSGFTIFIILSIFQTLSVYHDDVQGGGGEGDQQGVERVGDPPPHQPQRQQSPEVSPACSCVKVLEITWI